MSSGPTACRLNFNKSYRTTLVILLETHRVEKIVQLQLLLVVVVVVVVVIRRLSDDLVITGRRRGQHLHERHGGLHQLAPGTEHDRRDAGRAVLGHETPVDVELVDEAVRVVAGGQQAPDLAVVHAVEFRDVDAERYDAAGCYRRFVVKCFLYTWRTTNEYNASYSSRIQCWNYTGCV